MIGGATGAAMGKVSTLILAKDRSDYCTFVAKKGLKVPTSFTYAASYEGGWLWDGSGEGPTKGLHFDRIVITEGFRQRKDCFLRLSEARLCLAKGGRVAYDFKPESWYFSGWDVNGDPFLKDTNGGLRCNWCWAGVHETYHGGFCKACEGQMKQQKPKKADWKLLPLNEALGLPKPKLGGISKEEYEAYGFGGGTAYDKAPAKLTLVHKQGDIWKLPKANSPMWTDQWGYQGSSKAPYVVSHRAEGTGKAGGNTTEDGWACSCMNFTRNMPRTKCKHILNVMLQEGMNVNKTSVKMANEDAKKLAEFEKWQREKAAAKKSNNPTAGAKLNMFGTTTRKFR